MNTPSTDPDPRATRSTAVHTPTPWKAVDIHATERGKRGIVYYQIKQANSAKSAIGFAGVYEDQNPKADADFIIEAVNSHDALTARVAELEAALAEIIRTEEFKSYSSYGARVDAIQQALNNGRALLDGAK